MIKLKMEYILKPQGAAVGVWGLMLLANPIYLLPMSNTV